MTENARAVKPAQPVNMQVLSNPANLSPVREAVRRSAGAAGFQEADVEQIALAVDEALTNVIKHGYDGRHDQPIDIRIELVAEPGQTGLRCVIRDFGKAVDPDAICGRNLDDVQPGGLGVHIIRTVMDEVSYGPAEGGGTRLDMLKWKKQHG